MSWQTIVLVALLLTTVAGAGYFIGRASKDAECERDKAAIVQSYENATKQGIQSGQKTASDAAKKARSLSSADKLTWLREHGRVHKP